MARLEELKQPDQRRKDAAAAGERGLRKKHRTLREEDDAGVVADVGARRRKEVGSFGRVDSRERAREEVEREVSSLFPGLVEHRKEREPRGYIPDETVLLERCCRYPKENERNTRE